MCMKMLYIADSVRGVCEPKIYGFSGSQAEVDGGRSCVLEQRLRGKIEITGRG